MARKCELDSGLPVAVTYTYLGIYLLFAFYASISSFIKTKKKFQKDWKDMSLKKKTKAWFRDVWRLKKCYLPAIAHLFDQSSDAGVLAQFWELGEKEEYQGDDFCKGLFIYLFFSPSFALLILLNIFHRS